MTKICHISDWHGNWFGIPPADLYIITGDMIPNFPEFTRHYTIKSSNEEVRQKQWFEKMQEKFPGWPRNLFGSPDAPVVIVRGNHDFIDFGHFIGGEYWEVNEDSSRTVEYCGLKIGGFRGVPPISGIWSDELTQVERLARINTLPDDLDVVVCHSPPKGILSHRWGCSELAYQVYVWEQTRTKPQLCCFGHIHEEGGKIEEKYGILFSNAACDFNEIYL